MRKWLIFIAVLAAIILGVGLWLASKAETGKPDTGEVRQEIENVF